MATITQKTTTPIYALVGVADFAVSSAKGALDNAVDSASERALALKAELAPKAIGSRITGAVGDVRTQVGSAPQTATARYNAATTELEESYNGFVKRGESVVADLRNQPASKKLSEQVDEALEQGRSRISSVRRTVSDTQATAVGTVHAGRKEAAKGFATLAGRVSDGADKLEAEATTTTARSEAAKQGAAKKATARKAPAKKTAARKAPAKKAAPVKTAAPVKAAEATAPTTANDDA